MADSGAALGWACETFCRWYWDRAGGLGRCSVGGSGTGLEGWEDVLWVAVGQGWGGGVGCWVGQMFCGWQWDRSHETGRYSVSGSGAGLGRCFVEGIGGWMALGQAGVGVCSVGREVGVPEE